MCSPGEVVPGSREPGSGGLHRLPPTGAGPVPILLSLFFLFSFALPRYVGSFLPFGKSEVFCQRQWCSVGVFPRVDVFLMYLWGGR